MSTFKKTFLITSIINLLLLIPAFFDEMHFLNWFIYILLELFVSILVIIPKESREAGRAMLLVASLSLLIGFSVCSGLYLF
ncbi:MAG TPA: hypothetical protein VFR58_01440 [Flavisolibacter sp.]|nr:hypothetical protein [Flavisolibacter sp.]